MKIKHSIVSFIIYAVIVALSFAEAYVIMQNHTPYGRCDQ